MEKEVWKEVVGFDGYVISNYGNCYSLRFGKLKKLVASKCGKEKETYYCYTFSLKNKRYIFKVHRLVSSHFIENKNNYPLVNHKDFNTANNNVDNLEWVSFRQNVWHYAKSKGREIGVGFLKKTNKHRSRIYVNGKDIHLGFYDTLEEAKMSRIIYENNNNIGEGYRLTLNNIKF